MSELINYNATLNLDHEKSNLDAVIGATNALVPASDKINSGNSVNNSVGANDSATIKDILPSILDLKTEEINNVILPSSSTSKTSVFSNDVTSNSSTSDTEIDILTGLKVNEAVIDNSKEDSLTNPSASQSQTLNNTEQQKENVTPATSQSKTPDTSITSTENVALAPAIEKPSVSVEETSPVTDKAAVTSESEDPAIAQLDTGSTTPVSSEKPVVTTESSSSVTGDAGAIVSNNPAKNSDSAVVTNNNSEAIASELSKSDTAVVTTAAATSDPAKTETEVTSANSDEFASNNPAKNPDSAVVTNNNSEAIASELSKSDVVTTAAATSDPAKTETEVTSANSGAIAPAIEKPSVSVEETSPVTNKTAVTSESENKALASTSDITDSSQTPKNSINSTTADVTKTSITSTPAQNITQLTSQSFTFNTGVFKVDETGKVGIDYLFDGGGYEGELGIFNLEGMEKLAQNSDAFITEAARRSVSNSNLGYVVLNDATEGARFSGDLPDDINRDRGEYKGVKTFTMLPGDRFAFILVPNRANLQQVANKSAKGKDTRPLFSLPMANPNGSFMTGQIADVTGVGNTFVMEDLRVDKPGTDSDYNDIIFQVRGATGSAVSIDSVIDLNKDWRPTNLGKALIEYAKPYVTPENPKVGELVTDELYDSIFGNKDNQVDNNSKTEAIASEVSKSDTPVVTTPATSDPAKTETEVTSTNSDEFAPAIEKPSVSVEETSPVTDQTAVTSESENKAIAPLDSGATTPVSSEQPVVTTESSSSVTGDAGSIVSDTPPTNPDSVVVTDNNSGAIAPSNEETPVINTSSATSSSSNSTNTGGVTETQNQSSVVVVETVVLTDATGTNSGEEQAIATDKPWSENNVGAIASTTTDSNPAGNTQPAIGETLKNEQVVNLIASTTIDTNSETTAQSTVVETSDNHNEVISAIASTTTDTNSASNTQPTVVETVANEAEEIGAIISTPQETNSASTTELTVNVDGWVEQTKKDFAAVISQGNADLDSFQNELTNINNSLTDLAVKLAGEIYTAENNTSNQLYDTWSALDRSQTNVNQLWQTIASADQKTVGKVNSLWSEIKTAQDTYNANPLHTSIQNANNQMYRYYSETWDALYPNRGLYPDTWSQVESLYNYHKQALDQYTALKNQSNAVFNNAWNEYRTIGDFRQTAINNAISEYSTIASQLNNSWNQYSELQNNRDIIFNDAWSDYYNLNQQRWQIVSNAWNEHNAIKNSWNDWGGDTEAQIDTWAKIFKSEDRWYNPADNTPKSGLPLIGIIDTGFSAAHPDIDGSRITLGKDWVDGDTNPLLQPGEGNDHGSKILEIIAGTRKNDIGIDGINDRSPLWLGLAVGSDDWAQSLIEYVDTVKASGESNALVNLSFDLTQTNADGSITTRYELTALERAALTYAQQNNVLIVTATGNQASTMSALGEAVKEFDNIITVGSAEDWNRADYSSYGEVDYANYGKGVDLLAQGTASNGTSGTSVASAKVTGAASLLWAANPNLNYTQIIDILKRTATDLNTPGWDTQTGLGLLNIAAAVHLAKATEPQVYTPPSFNLVQDTLKNSNIPAVYWPEFYNYYYHSDLEAKLTGSVWNGATDAVASERATNITRKEVFRALPYFRYGLPDWLPDWVTGDAIAEAPANLMVNTYQALNPLPKIDGQSYSHYEIEDEPLRWSGWLGSVTWGGIKKVILVTNEDIKRQLEETKTAKDAAKNKVNESKQKLENEKIKAQEERKKLEEELRQRQAMLNAAIQQTNGEVTPEIIALQQQVDAKKAEIDLHQKASDAKIAALKSQLQEDERNLEQKNKQYEAAVAAAKAWQQQELERIRQKQEAAKKGFFDRLSDSVKQFSKDLGEKLKSSLDGIDVGAVLDVLKKIPVVGTVVNGIEGLIALVGGDWKQVVKNAINGVLGIIPGGSAVPEKLVNILVDVGWGIINKDYKTALKDILKELEVKNNVANTFVDVAWAMKDGDWKDVLSAGLSGAGFNNAGKFVDIAWAIKDGDYKKALSTGLSTTGFANADKFVDVAWAVKDGDYKKALSAGLETAGLGNAGTFVGNVFDAITDDYSLPGQSIDPAAIPQKHKLYEYLARGIAYEDPKVSATAEDAFKDDSISGNQLAVGEVLNSGYTVNKVISDPNTGFYAVGLVSTDGSKPPVLAVRGTGGSPTERQGIATLKDVLEDANPISIGYSQFQANKNEIEAWLAAQNQQGRRPDIVGHSLGGALAQTIAAEFTDKVGQTVTFNSPGIDDSIALKFALNGGNPENVTHYVVSGDIVQMAGEAFLPGQAVLSSYSNPFVWEKHGLAVLNGVEIKGEQKASGVKFSSLSVLDLSNPAFQYKELDYTLFLAALGLVSPYVSTSLSTRQTAEANRKAIGAFLNSNFQTIQSWVDAAWSIKDGDYLKALSTGFDIAKFQNGKNWIDMVLSVKDGDYLKALSTGFDVAKFQDGKNWVDMAWSLQQGDYLKALSTGFKVAGFPEGEHLAQAAVNLREGKYLDAFFEGMYMIPGVEDLVNAFKAVGDGNFKGVANSLAKVAGNPTLLNLLVG
ncbi:MULTISPECIES: S8 family serine peptidase [unclassified Microcoleus]|uniref:S8 family serine peptidase n=1 Tax=unclassified Microcoleus TaxID=2642155 RepID=UPI002FD21B4F